MNPLTHAKNSVKRHVCVPFTFFSGYERVGTGE